MRSPVFLSLLSFFLVLGCEKITRPISQEPPAVPEGSESQAISTFTLAGHAETGRKKWEIEGQTAHLLGEKVAISPVTAKSYGQVEMILAAERGLFTKVSRDVELRGDVVVTTSDGARLSTDSFDWKAEKETGTTPDWVTVTRPGMTVIGKGAVGYPHLERVRLERQVTVTLAGEKRNTVITCDGPLEVDYGRRRARFWRNVQVQDARGIICSDRLDVRLKPDVNEIDRAVFLGHVEIHEKGKYATAHRAHYWGIQGRTALLGHPRIVLLPENENR